jgi:hypothetical protein
MNHVGRARDLITFADGIQTAGLTDYAQRARAVAHDVLELHEQLQAERSTRTALQQRCDAQQQLLGQAAYQAAADPELADIPWPEC